MLLTPARSKFFSAAAVLFLFFCEVSYSRTIKDAMPNSWFKNTGFTSLEIRKYKSISNHGIAAEIKIADEAVVRKLAERIGSIPANGDQMKSFGPNAEHIELVFANPGGEAESVHIFQKRFKTPSTGFNSGATEPETGLYRDIDALLFPAQDKKILKVAGHEYKFKDFSVYYKGTEAREQKPGEPSVGPISRMFFLIKQKAGKEQELAVVSGQVSPQPQPFEINKERLILLPYETKTKERLYPDYFQIIKK